MQKDVLIVEYDDASGRALVKMLNVKGHRAVLAREETAVRRFLATETPCLILVGTLAPERMRSLIRFLRDHHRGIPTVIMSTTSEAAGGASFTRQAGGQAGGQAGEQAGGDDVAMDVPIVDRPADREALLRVVNRFCLLPGKRAVVN